MDRPASALLAVWNEVAPEHEADFAAWYLREHLPERLAVPGMTRARKYRARDAGSPANMALYEAETRDVLTSGAYRDQLANPTEWTRRTTTRFTFMRRAICDLIARAGAGTGGFATAIHFVPAPEHTAAARAWAQGQVAALVAMPGIVAAHCWAGIEGEPATPTSELSAKAVSDRPVGWVLAIEAADTGALDLARQAVLRHGSEAFGAAEWRSDPDYELSHQL